MYSWQPPQGLFIIDGGNSSHRARQFFCGRTDALGFEARVDGFYRLIKRSATAGSLLTTDTRLTHVAVYAVRYQRLLRFPVKPMLDRLAAAPTESSPR